MARRILLIDDSAMLRRIAGNILHAQPSRYEVVVATRAVEGFAMACAGGIDLILLDHRLGDVARTEVCHRLQHEARTEHIPVILMVRQGAEPPSLPENVVGTLVKPFSPEELSGMVNAVLGLTRVGSTLAELRASLHPEAWLARPVEAFEGARPSSSISWRDRGPGTMTPRPSGTLNTLLQDRAGFGDGACLFKGDTTATSLRMVMHSTADAGLTGMLRLWPGDGPCTEVFFDQGRLVVVSTRDGAAYAARAADALPTKVSAATLDDAVAEQTATGTPFLLTLGTGGLLSKSAAIALLDQFGQRQFARLWPQRCRPPVRYEFEPLDALPHYALRLSPVAICLDEWLFATTRHLRHEDLGTLLRHEGTVGTPSYQAGAEAVLKDLKLTEDEQALLELIDPRRDLPNLARSLGVRQEAAYLHLFRFRCLEVLSYRPAPAAFVMTPRTFLRRVLPLERTT